MGKRGQVSFEKFGTGDRQCELVLVMTVRNDGNE
jgi:hypothetical protein